MLFIHKLSKAFLVTSFITVSVCAQQVEDYSTGQKAIQDIMSHHETGIGVYNRKSLSCAETKNWYQDLNIPAIADYFGFKTILGRSFFIETLKNPLTAQSKEVILQRQQVIKALVENPELKKEVDEYIEKAKIAEQEIVKLFSEFYKGKNCPELKALAQIKQQNPDLYPWIESMTISPKGKKIALGISCLAAILYSGGVGINGYKIGSLIRKDGFNLKNVPTIVAHSFASVICSLFAGLTGYVIYKDIDAAIEKRSKLHAVNQLIVIAEKLDNFCTNFNIEMQFRISNITNDNGKELIKNLKHKRYVPKKKYLFDYAKVNTYLYAFYNQQQHLAEIFACIAEMDTYNAIATKIIESQDQANKFCFVNFIDEQNPVIRSVGFWNVLVAKPIVNDLHEDKHIILTGPNMGGKSTNIRSLLQNIGLAQAYGVAAAQTFESTFFDIIYSLINVSDDILNGLSLFATEVKRAQEVLERIKTLQPGQKFFFALDELFTGTNAEDGQTCAYEFIKRLLSFEGVQFIYATHFAKLTELEQESSHCINYKVDEPSKNADGKLVYPYTLSKGINQSRVALDLVREAQLFA